MDKLKMHSPDLTQRNIDAIKGLFPTVVTETVDADGNPVRAVDFDALRQELTDHVVEGPQERYQLDWPGKRAAAFAANAPIAKTLRPVREDSVNFDTTKNLFIEGDNLDALKLLQESYLGKVKLIYIDPPYNTGNDEFVYPDDYSEGADEHLLRSGQVNNAGERLRSNPDSNGRFHSDWLDMIYPRLKLAKSLLTPDGYIVVSIDDAEFSALELLLDEVFGASNKLAVLVWDRNRKNDARFFSVGHEYMIVYARNKSILTERGTRLREPQSGIVEAREFIADATARNADDWEATQAEWRKWTSSFPKDDERRKLGRFSKVGPRGPYRDDGDISWPGGGGPRFDILHPATGNLCKVPPRGWVFSTKQRFDEMVANGHVVFGPDETTLPRLIRYLFESEGLVMGSVHYSYAQSAAVDFMKLMGAKVFDNPKNWKDLRRIIEYLTEPHDIVVDFFAGSASTGHAVLDLNVATESQRRFILVQVAEPVPEKSVAETHAYETISGIARDRLRRVGDAIGTASATDAGFRMFRVDTTNMADTSTTADALGQGKLTGMIDSVKPDRTDDDLLFQVLLDWGLDLAEPIKVEVIEARRILSVANGALIACFAGEVTDGVVKAIARRHPLRAVFLDAGFANDAARINVEQIFREVSPATEVRAI
ncbi:site-specific DNA-methyltransferase [Ornithinimicrobium pratense]|uniref:Site-specific DNA-methyltransferase n=1 Tax=Ornithinimicrobium pratense TaxID=2593973 RepID=A0A5J6V236_9MICO|nr:site-specific DNA-methyltransferase [Ornithinimicrobium pratense]QFG67344.1 site-specific DNA-methyltransferase [Ornithinimicrobium pratense]